MVIFERITEVENADLNKVFELYELTFPAHERMPSSWIQENFENHLTEIWIGLSDGEFALMAILEKLVNSQAILLGYLATVPHLRNAKIGSRFLSFLLQQAQERSQSIFLEVEYPNFGEAYDLKQRRVGFYRKFGARCFSVTTVGDLIYWLPSFSGEAPTEMLLMLIDPLGRSSFSKSEVQQYIQTIYQQVYRIPKDDPIFQWLIDLPEQINLR